MTFFDDYPEFYKTSKTKPFPNRLNMRYKALIESNLDKIRNCSILDIASHDGRWSFAAIKNGAKFVCGIEGRVELVENSNQTMKKYNVSNNMYKFIEGDINQEIKKLEPGKFDTIFCFGFFYHTMNHLNLLAEIKRLNPKWLILDTVVSKSDTPIIELHVENSNVEAYAIKTDLNVNEGILVGWPSKKALEMMLDDVGFSYEYYNWHDGKITNWENLESYQYDGRVTLTAKNLNVG